MRRGLSGAWALLPALFTTPLAAQGQGVVLEWGLHSTATVISGGAVGLVAGPRAAVRTVGGTRLAVSVGAGFLGDEGSVRSEGAVEYVLTPRVAGRLGVYMGGGLAGVLGAGRGGYLLAYVGLERSPGLPAGWAVEAGLGNGFRIRAAYHWRHFPKGWRPQK